MVALVMGPQSIRPLYKLSQVPQDISHSSCLKDTIVKVEFSTVAVSEEEVQIQRCTQNFSCWNSTFTIWPLIVPLA